MANQKRTNDFPTEGNKNWEDNNLYVTILHNRKKTNEICKNI